ncbi:MAG: diguanylate cyclase [Dokdonella sp.]|uniref:GGDEF domain-containing protein n=1 Tax=Dokdonella sp. TaxID=2291710 RepID=UPI003264ADE7
MIVLRLFAGLLLLLCAPAFAAKLTLDGGWRAADAGETAASVTRADARIQRFDPARQKAFSGGANGNWVLLWPAQGLWPAAPWVLEVRSPGLQTVTLYPPDPAIERPARLMQPGADTWPGHGQLVFPIDRPPLQGEPLRLRVDARGVVPAPMMFSVLPVVEHLRRDAGWLAFASACLGIMAAMAIMALMFALLLRDPAFLFYAMFVLAYALILALQTGYVADPLAWHAAANAPRLWGRIATTLCVVFAILFLDRFAQLQRYAPTGRLLLFVYAGALALISLLGLAVPVADTWGLALTNPMLIIGGPLLLGVAALATVRGSRYAGFFLLGWTPLLGVTVLGGLQSFGFADWWTGNDSGAFGAGALEALILSLGLADRSLVLRRDRDHARRLADIDALTGLYNRRAWTERTLALVDAIGPAHPPLSALFLDLDHFKELNDREGHESGDSVLRALAAVMVDEVRQQDVIGRFGGEEFVITLPGADREHALRVGERIRRGLRDRTANDSVHATQTVSIGAATLQPGEDVTALLKRADEAMYAAKAAGRNRVVFGDAAANHAEQ